MFPRLAGNKPWRPRGVGLAFRAVRNLLTVQRRECARGSYWRCLAALLLTPPHAAHAQAVAPEPNAGLGSNVPIKTEGPADPTATPDADAAFETGVAAYRRGDYIAAREAFTQAYEQDPSYRTAAVLGQTEEKLGHLPQAATLLNWAVFHLDGHVEPEAKARIQADLALLKDRVLTLKLETPVQFQEVLIDDLVFTSNSVRILAEGGDKWTIYLEPEQHDVIVRSEGYHPQQRQVEGAAGQLLDWQLSWEPVTEPNIVLPPRIDARPSEIAVSERLEPASVADHSVEWQLPVAIATGGLTLVAGAFGFYSLHEYSAAAARFDEARATLRSSGLPRPCSATAPVSTRNACQVVAAADHDAVNHGNRAIATFTAAGALALGSAAFWVWWWNKGEEHGPTASWYVAPLVDESNWGGVVQYRY